MLMFTFLVLPVKWELASRVAMPSKATVTEGQANLAGDEIRSPSLCCAQVEVPGQDIQLAQQAVASLSVG